MSRSFLQAVAAALLAACQSEGAAQRQERGGNRPFTVTEVADFSTPWAMAFLPGSGVPLTNMALLTEKGGKLWLVDVSQWPADGGHGRAGGKVAGQGGLGDVMPHPDFAGNRRVYLSYVEAGEGGTSGAVLGYGTLDLSNAAAPALRDFKVIWRQQPKVTGDGHFSHRIAFGPDGFLYLTSGDRQKMDAGAGIQRQPRQGPAPDRRGRARAGQSMGVARRGRRPILDAWAIATYWAWPSLRTGGCGRAKWGRKGGDEINLILPGKNYGWPRASNGSHYGGARRSRITSRRRLRGAKSLVDAIRSRRASLMIYTGDKFPQWKGDALVGALSGEALIRIDINGDKARKADQWPMGERIRAVDQGPDGERLSARGRRGGCSGSIRQPPAKGQSTVWGSSTGCGTVRR